MRSIGAVISRWVALVRGWSRQRQAGVAVGVALLVVGVAVALSQVGGSTPRALPPTPPSPVSSVASPTLPTTATTAPGRPSSRTTSTRPRSGSSATRTAPAHVRPIHCGGSVPAGGVGATHVCIPAIGVDADVIPLGLNADRTIEVPPLSEVGLAGWYRYSPAPGADGPSIILGHIDSAQYGKGVFYYLGQLRAGERIIITRADGMVATYRVDRVGEYPKSSFPTALVYGNTPTPTVRLITCGGAFDASAGNYLDNIIAFGSLVSLK